MRWFHQLAALFAKEEELSLQIRLFRLICAATGLLCLVVVLPINALQNLPIAVNIAVVVLGLFAVGCFYESHRSRHHTTTFFVVFVGLLTPVWFLNAGSQGSIGYYFLPLALYPIAIFRGRRRWILTVSLGLDFCGLLLVEHFFPSLTVPFQRPIDQLLDLVSGAFCSFLTVAMIAWLIVDSHDREQRRLAATAQSLAASERQLRESKQRLTEVFRVLAEGIAVQHPSAVIEDCNEAAEQILGLTHEQVVGLRPVDFIGQAVHPDGRPFLPEEFPVAVTVRTGQPQRGVEMMINPAGGDRPEIHLLINTAPILDDAGVVRMVVTSFSDITGRKQAEADRLVLGKLESTGVLAGGIAHDFNNLLTAILLNLELAESAQTSRADLQTHLHEARQASLAAKSLTQQLVTFAQGGEPVRQLSDVEQILRDAVQISLSGATVVARITVAPGLRAAEVDPGQIRQVFRNLVLNASEAMPRGGRVSIGLENAELGAADGLALPPGYYLRVSIADEGDGILPEALPKIFDPYFSTKTRGVQKGMGLGLTICHSIVQKHGGAITADSTPGKGSTFCVYLPASSKAIPAKAEPPPAATGDLRRGKILVMDDERIIRDVIRMAAARMGCAVTVAGDGQEAIGHYVRARETGESFDLVLLDLTVRNGMGGLETMRQLRELDPAVKAAVMSGYANDQVLQQHAGWGFRDALRKPFDLAALQAVISRALGD
jgi:PAS domain S-box-containing protein